MKSLNIIYVILLSFMVFSGCIDEDKILYTDQLEDACPIGSVDLADRFQSPLHTGTRNLHTVGILVSKWRGYTAENIGFDSSNILWAVFGNDGDTSVVKAFQNLIRITHDPAEKVNEIVTTLVPTPEYYACHPKPDLEKFRFYERDSDFTGYEIYSSPEDGSVFAAWYYENGRRQYGTIIYEHDPHYRMKSAFMERILRKVSFFQTEKKETRGEYKEYEEVEEIEIEDGKTIKIIWRHIIPIGNNQLDNDNPGYNYLSLGSGGRYDACDYLQKDTVEIKGSLFAQEKVLQSYTLNSSFPLGGYGSSPCLAISLALLYYDTCITPDDIWIGIDSPDNFYHVFDDYIDPNDLEFLISKYFICRKVPANSIRGIINNGKLCITVSRTGDSQCFYKCMLIVGYTIDRYLIYLDPVTGAIKCRPNDCLDEFTFVIDRAL